MAVRLVALDRQSDIPLDRLLVVVGRDRRCDVCIDSLRISRRHCCLALDGEGALVRDLGSVNGTWINGERVDEGFLRPGDELAVGHLRYRLDFEAYGAVPERRACDGERPNGDPHGSLGESSRPGTDLDTDRSCPGGVPV